MAEVVSRETVNHWLAGAYDQAGIERWWQRPRVQLGNRSPQQLWDDKPEYRSGIVKLARSLYGDETTTTPHDDAWKG